MLREIAQQDGFLGGELLASPSQPGLALLQARFDRAPSSADWPSGAKGWTFTVVEAIAAPSLRTPPSGSK
ncbi:hypothetical protein [Deinococcus yavapaiensis]|uniref:hypothetical protein n=1 Tax=Deinococcus yavapaiensis TaxID=309889 RepID=UPI001FE3FDC8|nr:hypothetical protein [Deinococcus yavapaiensis]